MCLFYLPTLTSNKMLTALISIIAANTKMKDDIMLTGRAKNWLMMMLTLANGER